MMNMILDTLRLTVDGGIARLTLTNSAKGNPLGPAFGGDLLRAACTLEGRADVRAVLFSAEGRNFCVGGDLGYFASQDDLGATLRAMTADYHAALSILFRLRAPIVTAVQGASEVRVSHWARSVTSWSRRQARTLRSPTRRSAFLRTVHQPGCCRA